MRGGADQRAPAWNQVAAAYATLGDPKKKALYDAGDEIERGRGLGARDSAHMRTPDALPRERQCAYALPRCFAMGRAREVK